MNIQLETYLSHLNSFLTFKIYFSIENNSTKLIHFYENLYSYQIHSNFFFKSIHFDLNNEEILLNYFFTKNSLLIYLTISLYLFCLFFFVKNTFFILIILFHILLTYSSYLIFYIYLFHFPITILNLTSLIFFLFLILIDAYLWYSCWFSNNHRRDDCTIQRIIENLVTQTFYYLLPKNLTAIIALVITYTNQIIAIQCFTMTAFFLISISFLISFTLYPGKLEVCLMRIESIPPPGYVSINPLM